MRFLSTLIFYCILAMSPVNALSVGDTLPNISIPELSSNAQKSLASFKGKVMLIDFWGSWCIPCKSSFPQYEKFYGEYGSQGLVILGINEDQTVDPIHEFLATYPVSFPILHDVRKEAAQVFKPSQMPTAFLVDRGGKIVKIYEGFRESEVTQMKNDIEQLLGR